MSNFFGTFSALFVTGFFSGCATHTLFTPDGVKTELPTSAKTLAPADRDGNFHLEKNVTYIQRPDEAPQTGDLYWPSQRIGPFPVVLVVHGGGWDSGGRWQMNLIAKRLAERGIAAFNVDYRLAPQYRYPAPVEDLRAALAWLKENAARFQLDPHRVGGYGYSAGANLIDLLALSDTPLPLKISAVVSGGTPSDLTRFKVSPLVKKYLGGNYAEKKELHEKASPRFALAKSVNRPKFFLYHGQNDKLVPMEQMELFRDTAIQAGYGVETYTVKGLGHIAMFLFSADAVKLGIDFLAASFSPQP